MQPKRATVTFVPQLDGPPKRLWGSADPSLTVIADAEQIRSMVGRWDHAGVSSALWSGTLDAEAVVWLSRCVERYYPTRGDEALRPENAARAMLCVAWRARLPVPGEVARRYGTTSLEQCRLLVERGDGTCARPLCVRPRVAVPRRKLWRADGVLFLSAESELDERGDERRWHEHWQHAVAHLVDEGYVFGDYLRATPDEAKDAASRLAWK